MKPERERTNKAMSNVKAQSSNEILISNAVTQGFSLD
jgi:hypothetical protein